VTDTLVDSVFIGLCVLLITGVDESDEAYEADCWAEAEGLVLTD